MSYTALYRKFRPQKFCEVRGQEHIVTALQNQIRMGRISHAYLFTGTRGTGKTTMARIFAKAVNCENSVDGEPCDECETCVTIRENLSFGIIIELDAASHSGVEDIRQITDLVNSPPQGGRYKVFIIDEVHMLSREAFNALLKTLEEPPEYVIFILATTDVQKVPVTILSRVQRWDFHRISLETITDRMRELMEKEQIAIDDQALRYIAKAGDGSMRDALSILDKAIATYTGDTITYEDVLASLGTVDTEVFYNILQAIRNRDVSSALDSVGEAVADGRELGQYVADFLWYLRNVLMAKNLEVGSEDLLDMSREQFLRLKEQGENIEEAIILRYIRILSSVAADMRASTEKRVLLEVAIIRMCKPQMEKDVNSLVDRITELEKKLENGEFSVSVVPQEGVGPASPASATKMHMIPEGTPEDVKKFFSRWQNFVDQYPEDSMAGILRSAVPSVTDDGKLLIAMGEKENVYGVSALEKEDSPARQLLIERICKLAQAQIPVEFAFNKSDVDIKKLYEDGVTKFAQSHEGIVIEETDDEDF